MAQAGKLGVLRKRLPNKDLGHGCRGGRPNCHTNLVWRRSLCMLAHAETVWSQMRNGADDSGQETATRFVVFQAK